MSLTIVPKDSVHWTEGRKTGVIVEVQDKPQVLMPDGSKVNYVDLVIEDEETHNQIKTGFSSNLSLETKLGAFLKEMKIAFQPRVPIDLEKALVGKRVSFSVVNKKGKSGDRKFANIVDGSLEHRL